MTNQDTQATQTHTASYSVVAQIFIIAFCLVLAIFVACGLYWGVVELYHQIYPVPPTAAVSLSAGFDIAAPTQSSATPVTPPAEGGAASGTIQTQSGNTTETKLRDDKGRPFFFVEGKVQKLGKPITNAMVKLTVERLIGDFRISQLLNVDENGRFYASFFEIQKNDQLRVQAEVWSQDLVGEPQLSEELYLGSPAPIRVRTTLYLVSGAALFISIFVFAYAFTGPQDAIKNRVAIIYSYCVIFVFLFLPLVAPYMFVHAFPGLQRAMKETPVGLVVAKPDPESKDSKPQWLLNLGGHVVPSKDDTSVDEIVGGLAIPFYVVLLSLMGGTINMTRQVPLLQDQSQNAKFTIGFVMTAVKRLSGSLVVKRTALARTEVEVPVSKDAATQPIDKNAGDWRTGLLNQYMYLASAPFLAIATYYVLDLLGATKIPILVIMSFSVGLISEHILVAITDFADGVIRGLKKQGQNLQTAPQSRSTDQATTETQEDEHNEGQKTKVKPPGQSIDSATPVDPSSQASEGQEEQTSADQHGVNTTKPTTN